MPYYVRLMRQEDITQVAEIDREAFPNQWAPNYQRELQDRLTHYIVVCDGERVVGPLKAGISLEREGKGLVGVVSRVRRLLDHNYSDGNLLPVDRCYIIGYAGFSVIADEAHITSIAVRKTYRQRGAGEMMLIAIIDSAKKLKATLVTLEVRVSNRAARNLYTKYSFAEVGIRRGYYTDDREDGLLMTIPDINQLAFQQCFEQLKQDYARWWGVTPAPVVIV